jgi:hypothetical protein
MNKQIFLKLFSYFRDIKETKLSNYIFSLEDESEEYFKISIDFNTLV